jgi:hypothetical protein
MMVRCWQYRFCMQNDNRTKREAQYSWLARHPWHVAPGQHASANLNVVYLRFRYFLPGLPPAPK